MSFLSALHERYVELARPKYMEKIPPDICESICERYLDFKKNTDKVIALFEENQADLKGIVADLEENIKKAGIEL